MGSLSKSVSALMPKPSDTKIEIATIISLSPFTIKIGNAEYDATSFTIYAPLPFKLTEQRPIDIHQVNRSPIIGYSVYREYDLILEIDRDKTLPYEEGDIIAVVDKGDTFIIVAVLCDMQGGVKL